jgi:hypothetical protein
MCSEVGISRWTLLLSSFLKKNLRTTLLHGSCLRNKRDRHP